MTYDILPEESTYASPKVVYFNTANGADDDYVMKFTVTKRWANIYISPSHEWSPSEGESPRYITDCPSPNSETYTFMDGDLAASDMFGGGDGWFGPADECGGSGGGGGGSTDDFHVVIGDPTEFAIRVPGDDSESLGDEFALVGERIPLQGYKHDDDDTDAEINGPDEPGDWNPPANTDLYAADSGGSALTGDGLKNKINVYAEASVAGAHSFTAVPSADPEGGQSGEKTLTFHALDMDISGVDDEYEEDPGGYVAVYSSACTNSLKAINVTLPPSRMKREVTLKVEEGAEIVKIWKTADRTEEVIGVDASEKSWPTTEEVPLTLHVEALATSTNKFVYLKMEYADHGGNTNGWDRVKLDIIRYDLDINTDDHPRTAGVPVASSASDIDDDDDDEEESLGGYLWVNDDNDNEVSNDTLLDFEDSADYVDNDLEPITYTIPQSVWDHGLEVEVEVNFPDNHVKIWSGNKNNEVLAGTYSSASDLDDDEDGVLYLEGLKSGSGTIVLKIKDGETIVCEDTIKATVFAVAEVKWANYSSPGINTNVGPDPGGQAQRTGVRVFPGKAYPDDETKRNMPRITVSITPEIPAGSGWYVPVAARVYDVDHYSSGSVEGERFDDETSSRDKEGHDIGYEPNDNRTGYGEAGDSHHGKFEEAGDEYNIGIEVVDVGDDTVAYSIIGVFTSMD